MDFALGDLKNNSILRQAKNPDKLYSNSYVSSKDNAFALDALRKLGVNLAEKGKLNILT